MVHKCNASVQDTEENCPEFEASISYRIGSSQACDTYVRPYFNNVNPLIN